MHNQTIFAVNLLLATCNVSWCADHAVFCYLPNTGFSALGAIRVGLLQVQAVQTVMPVKCHVFTEAPFLQGFQQLAFIFAFAVPHLALQWPIDRAQALMV